MNFRANSPSFSRRSFARTANGSKTSRNAAPTAAASAPLRPATSAFFHLGNSMDATPVTSPSFASALAVERGERSLQSVGLGLDAGLARRSARASRRPLTSDVDVGLDVGLDSLDFSLSTRRRRRPRFPLARGCARFGDAREPRDLGDAPKRRDRGGGGDGVENGGRCRRARAARSTNPDAAPHAVLGVGRGAMTAAESLSGMGSDLTASAPASYVAPGPECATTAPRALRKPAWSSLRSFLAHCECAKAAPAAARSPGR